MSKTKKHKKDNNTKDNTLLNILFKWKEKDITEGRFAVYTPIHETSKGKYKMDEKIYIKLISDSLEIKEFLEKGQAMIVDKEFLQNPFAVPFLLLELFSQNSGKEILSLMLLDIDKEELHPTYEYLLETILYPHEIEINKFAVCKEFFFTFTHTGLILAPFIQGFAKIDV